MTQGQILIQLASVTLINSRNTIGTNLFGLTYIGIVQWRGRLIM